ncbi:CapA family protein [Alteribacter natronophilus]|uniref:CapA family protein n=1 Tax=Alteribacter natronophilus TaxID=2583810 RepID=UPI00110DDEDF|nr:CapA family protein [Alteribacter natronophilus]TMW72200.1 CapA family protein [Alteribacter natronophilus]
MTTKKRYLTKKEKLLAMTKRHKERADRHALVFFIALAVLIGAGQFVSFAQVPEVAGDDEAAVTGTVVGDIMLGRHVSQVTGRYGFSPLFDYARPYFEASDYVSGNFKQTIIDMPPEAMENFNGDTITNITENPNKPMNFSTTFEAVEALIDEGFTNVSLGNNNQFDYRYLGFRNTLNVFDYYNDEISYVGAGVNTEAAITPVIDEFNGMTVATVGFTDVYAPNHAVDQDRSGVLTTRRLADVYEAVQQAEQQADFVIVHAHWGENFNNRVFSRQREIAHYLADLGADLIVGHYPHVISPVEVYEDSLILYSVGNFVSDQGWSRTSDALITQFRLMRDGSRQFVFSPMMIREARPLPAVEPFGTIQKQRIFRTLTKELGDDVQTWREDGRLYLQIGGEQEA